MEYKKYNIYKAYIETGDPQHNNRPVLLLEDDNKYQVFDIYNITHDDSAENKPEKDKNANYKYNYKIKKWKEAGLDKPSLIKVREILNIDKKLLFENIGTLQAEDVLGMDNLIAEMYEDDLKAIEKYNTNQATNKIEIPDEIINDIEKKENNIKPTNKNDGLSR